VASEALDDLEHRRRGACAAGACGVMMTSTTSPTCSSGVGTSIRWPGNTVVLILNAAPMITS
jgi:hypothetical protein